MTNVTGSYHDIASMTALRARAEHDPNGSLREVAEQFESIFISMMLSTARESIVDGGLFNSGTLKTYQSMFDQEISVQLSKGGGLGLADLIVQQLGGEDG